MADLATLRARRDSLEESLASGVVSMSVDGQSTNFATMAERRRELNLVLAAIAECTGQASKRPTSSQVYLGGFQ